MNPSVDFHGEERKNDTHESRTDPEARLARKGQGREAKLSYAAHLLTENRNGLIVNTSVTQATGTPEREAGKEMVGEIPGRHQVTVEWLLLANQADTAQGRQAVVDLGCQRGDGVSGRPGRRLFEF